MKTSGRVRLKLRSRNFYKKGENFKIKPINFTDKIRFVIKCIIFLKNLILIEDREEMN